MSLHQNPKKNISNTPCSLIALKYPMETCLSFLSNTSRISIIAKTKTGQLSTALNKMNNVSQLNCNQKCYKNGRFVKIETYRKTFIVCRGLNGTHFLIATQIIFTLSSILLPNKSYTLISATHVANQAALKIARTQFMNSNNQMLVLNNSVQNATVALTTFMRTNPGAVAMENYQNGAEILLATTKIMTSIVKIQQLQVNNSEIATNFTASLLFKHTIFQAIGSVAQAFSTGIVVLVKKPKALPIDYSKIDYSKLDYDYLAKTFLKEKLSTKLDASYQHSLDQMKVGLDKAFEGKFSTSVADLKVSNKTLIENTISSKFNAMLIQIQAINDIYIILQIILAVFVVSFTCYWVYHCVFEYYTFEI